MVTDWSAKSRRNCWKTIAALPWARYPAVLFLTLTYPGQAGKEFIPGDGDTVTVHRRAFLKRWHRAYGPALGVWKREFQERKGEWDHEYQRRAAHLHVWLPWVHPAGISDAELADMRTWANVTWAGIVGSGSREHAEAGTSLDVLVGSDGRHPLCYFKGYLTKSGRKEYQNQVPRDFDRPGRFWGTFGGFRPEWHRQEVTGREFVRLRRWSRQAMRARRRAVCRDRGVKLKRSRYGSGQAGLWVAGGPAFGREMRSAVCWLRADAREAPQPGRGSAASPGDQWPILPPAPS